MKTLSYYFSYIFSTICFLIIFTQHDVVYSKTYENNICNNENIMYSNFIQNNKLSKNRLVQYKNKIKKLWKEVRKGDVHSLAFFGFVYYSIPNGFPYIHIKSDQIDKVAFIFLMNAYDLDFIKIYGFICNNNGEYITTKNHKNFFWHDDLEAYIENKNYKLCINKYEYNKCFKKMVSDGAVISLNELLNQIERQNTWLIQRDMME